MTQMENYAHIYDKRDDFNFSIVNFPVLCSNIPASPAYGVYISQLICYGRACSNYEDFIARGQLLTTRLQQQGYTTPRLKSTFRKFFGRQHDIVGVYDKSASVCSGISRPLTEDELRKLDPRVREQIQNRKTDLPHHQTKSGQYKSLYVSNAGQIYSNVQVFTQTVNVDATLNVKDSTLLKAANTIAHVVKHMPSDVFAGVARSHGVGIFTQADTVAAFPENYQLADSPSCHGSCAGACAHTCSSDGRKYSEMAGLTNTRSVVLAKNVDCAVDDPYSHQENVLVHEFSHLVFKYMPQALRDRVKYVYNYAKTHNVWYNSYAMSNVDEYWAEASSSFFLTVTRQDGPAGGMNMCNFASVCTSEAMARNFIKSHDPWLFDSLSYVYTNNHPTLPSGLRVCM